MVRDEGDDQKVYDSIMISGKLMIKLSFKKASQTMFGGDNKGPKLE
jgi:hypothetical protein